MLSRILAQTDARLLLSSVLQEGRGWSGVESGKLTEAVRLRPQYVSECQGYDEARRRATFTETPNKTSCPVRSQSWRTARLLCASSD